MPNYKLASRNYKYSYQPPPSNYVVMKAPQSLIEKYYYCDDVWANMDFRYGYMTIDDGCMSFSEPIIRTDKYQPKYVTYSFSQQYYPNTDRSDLALRAFVERFDRLPMTGNEHCVLIQDPDTPVTCRLVVMYAGAYIKFISHFTRSGQAFLLEYKAIERRYRLVFEEDGVHAHLENI
jgi:hypothetical protein